MVTRSLLGWLEDTRGSDADFNPEMEALREKIRVVDEDEECVGSYILPDEDSTPFHPASASFAGREFADAELVDSWNGDLSEIGEGSSFRWCGLDAINAGLSQRGMSPISKDEAVRILAVTERDVEQHGISVNELEVLLNTREQSVAVIDLVSKKVFRLRGAVYKDLVIAVGFGSAPHFISLRQG
jgi:hypothetical protein